MSRSSSEAEYRALSQTTSEGQWILYLLREFHIKHSSSIVIYCDNKLAFHVTINLVFHKITKYIEIDYHVVRDKVQMNSTFASNYIQGSNEIYFDQIIHIGPFSNQQNKLGMIDISYSLKGVLNIRLTSCSYSLKGMLNIRLTRCW